MVSEPEKIQMPRLGGHLHSWGSGHTCVSREPHDQCVCECGTPAPYNGLADQYRAAVSWEYNRGKPAVQ